MDWKAFRDEAPGLVSKAEALFECAGVLLVGTIRKDGSPRISPVEPLVVGDDLYLGMMWRSTKALDLLRDARCTVHSAVADREASGGEFKMQGTVREVTDPAERRRYRAALAAKIGWELGEAPFHLFAVQPRSAAHFITEGDARLVTKWLAGAQPRAYRRGAASARLLPLD